MPRPVCLLACALAATPLFCAGDDQVVFRSDVSLVRVDAQVVDRDNRALTGLRVDDFVLLEEGKAQPIRNFSREEMPVDVLLLLDVSASMRVHVQRIADAAHDALRVLGNQDRVGIMVFDRSTRLRLPFNSNRAEVQREFERLLSQETFNGGTDITRGLLDAAKYVGREGRRDARRAIVILTDDQTERNRDELGVGLALARAETVLSALIAPDAMQNARRGGYGGPVGHPRSGGGIGGPLGGIILGRPGGSPGGYPGGGYPGGGGRQPGGMSGPHTQSAGTSEIARRSGGDSIPVDDASAFEDTLARIRQRYALHFYLPPGVKAGQERNITVALSETARRRYPGAEVRFRRTYIAPADSGAATDAPVVITQKPGNAPPAVVSTGGEDAEAPQLRRRRAVNQVPDDDRSGPAAASRQADPPPANDSSAAPNRGSWRKAADADSAPAAEPKAAADQPAGTKPADTAQPSGGWRKLKPGEQP